MSFDVIMLCEVEVKGLPTGINSDNISVMANLELVD